MKYINLIKSAINKVLDRTIGLLEMAVLGIIVVSTLSYALAWQAPGGNPPTSNTDTPINTGSTGQAKSGGLILNTGGAATGLIVQNGNVGIGTTSPSKRLEVVGQEVKFTGVSATNLNLYLNRARNWSLESRNDSTFVIRDNSAGADRINIDTSGNIGIGTANPQAKLDVAGNAKFSGGVEGLSYGDCTTVSDSHPWNDMMAFECPTGYFMTKFNCYSYGNNFCYSSSVQCCRVR